jgi:hypothetical protein
MPLDPRRVKELFNAALDLIDPADRPGFLDRECGDDRALRQRLDELLAAHDRPAEALEQPLAADPEKPTAPDAEPGRTTEGSDQPDVAGPPTASYRPGPPTPLIGSLSSSQIRRTVLTD